MVNQAHGRPTKKAPWHVKALLHTVPSKLLAPPLRLPFRLPPGLALADQTQAVTQAVVGHMQVMLKKFEQSFERRLTQMEAHVPKERSTFPLHDSAPRGGADG